MSLTRIVGRTLGLGAAAGAALTAYAVTQTRAFVLREATVPVLPPGHPALRVLHLSDLHLTPRQGVKQRWVRELSGLRPDLVLNTGDNLAHRDSVPVLLDALGDLLDVPGAFVLGSNDYFEPTLRNPLSYLLPDSGKRHVRSPQMPWRLLRSELSGAGWLDLTNATGRLSVQGTDIAFAGVDDPHLRLDELDAVSSPVPADADLRLAVAHAPYLRVLDRFAGDGWDMVIAGHTHGGQVCLPGGRALTTNCDLEPARAKGLHRHPAGSEPGDPGSAWLHVSAGLGTSPYAQIRVACRPEATLMNLVARDGDRFPADRPAPVR